MAVVCLLGAALLATPIVLVGLFVPNAVNLDDLSLPGSPVAPLEERTPADEFQPGYGREPAARAILDGKWRLTHLARSKQGTVARTHQLTPAQDDMAGWTDLGGNAAGNPVAVLDSHKRMAAFVVGTDGSLSYNPQVEADAPEPGTWQDLGGAQLIGTPAAAQDATGRLHVFARSAAGGLWETHESRAGEGGWTGLREIPGPPIQDDPAVHIDSQHTLKVFALGSDGVVRTHSQAVLGGDEWDPAQEVPGIAAISPAVIVDEFGKMHLFAQGINGEILQSTERDAVTNVWSGWRTWRQWRTEPGTFADRPMVAMGATGILVVFTRDANGAVYESWQAESQRSRWFTWQPHEGDVAELTAAVKDSAGKMVVYAIARDGTLTRTRQDSPSSGPWHEWATDLGGELNITTTS
ncbi:hypothetical protein ABZ805_03640 [Saccharopolyspora sp. NPDC047091]|uniref:hypothetical protein n=1 Tax=Saccharopolyspora sp. NPDC047091 TaxID=3155924 RepID=UPI00340790EB